MNVEHPSLARGYALPELPPPDASIQALSQLEREGLGAYWQGRAALELTATGVLTEVLRTLFDSPR